MPRDATATRERLIREAERLFARRGVWQVTVRDITTAAGQRNASVIHYHFGSLEGLRQTILEYHGLPMDVERVDHLAAIEGEPTDRDLIDALLVPYGRSLATAEGRNYVRIVAQYTGFFGSWDSTPGSPHLIDILCRLRDGQKHLDPEIREQRILGIVILIGGAMGERAKHLDDGDEPMIDHERFVSNLASMLVAALEAPG